MLANMCPYNFYGVFLLLRVTSNQCFLKRIIHYNFRRNTRKKLLQMLWLQNKLFAAWKVLKKNVCIFQKMIPLSKKIMVRPLML